MKKLIVLLVAFLMLIFCNASTSQAITLGFDPISDVLVGDSVDVNVVISGLGDGIAPSLGEFDMDINFDPAILGFNGVTFGSRLGDPEPSSFETSIDFTDYGTGTVNIWELSWLLPNDAYSQWLYGYSVPPYLDDIQPVSFTLATLTFDTIALGTSPLNISSCILGDAYGDPLTLDFVETGSINNVVPEPATMLLLGSGLAGLGFLRKKKKNQVS